MRPYPVSNPVFREVLAEVRDCGIDMAQKLTDSEKDFIHRMHYREQTDIDYSRKMQAGCDPPPQGHEDLHAPLQGYDPYLFEDPDDYNDDANAAAAETADRVEQDMADKTPPPSPPPSPPSPPLTTSPNKRKQQDDAGKQDNNSTPPKKSRTHQSRPPAVSSTHHGIRFGNKLEERMAVCDLSALNVRGDGNCMFHAIHQYLTGEVDGGCQLRLNVGAFVGDAVDNRITTEGPHHENILTVSLKNDLLNLGRYAEGLEIMATVEYLRVLVTVCHEMYDATDHVGLHVFLSLSHPREGG